LEERPIGGILGGPWRQGPLLPWAKFRRISQRVTGCQTQREVMAGGRGHHEVRGVSESRMQWEVNR